MRKKIFALASLLIIASMILVACSPAATATPEKVVETVQVVQTVVVTQEGVTTVVTATPQPTAEPKGFKSKDPTTLTYAQFGDPETLDPGLDYETAGGEILFNVYDTLVFFNKDDPNSFIAQLAEEVPTKENGGLSADGATYTFKVRKGIKFHDGTDLTPTDIAYSFQRNLLQGGSASPQWLLAQPVLGVDYADITDVISPTLIENDKNINPPGTSPTATVKSVLDDPANLAKLPADVLKAACEKVTNAIVADDAASTVTFKLASPWAPFLATLGQPWGSAQSKAWAIKAGGWDGSCDTWQKYYGKTSDELAKTDLGTKAMGTGPYILDHWTPSQEIVLKANESYWRKEPAWEGGPTGAPKLKTIIYKNVNEFSTRYAMLQAGDADWIVLGSSSDYPQMDELVGEICDYKQGQGADGCKPTDKPDNPLRLVRNWQQATRTDAFFTWQINTSGGNNFIGSGKLDGNGIPSDFFNDVHVRRAFAYCFDYETYLKDVLFGEAVRSIDVMLPGQVGYNEKDPTYTYDPAKCEEEFKASTWKSADGKSLWDTGFRLTMAYNTGNTQRQTISQIFQNQLASVNEKFVVEVTGLPWPTFLKNSRANKLPIFSSGWLEDIHETHNWVVPYTTGTYGSKQGLPKELKTQFLDLTNKAVVETDPAKRAQIYEEFNKLFYDQIPTILLYITLGRHYEQRWLHGWYNNPVYTGPYWYPMWKD